MQRNPDRYVVAMTHGGLGLPEREYYRRTDGEFPNIRAQYVAHIERMLTLCRPEQRRRAKRARSWRSKRSIAERHWPIADRRERDRTYNLKTRAEMRAMAPNFPWDAGFESAGTWRRARSRRARTERDGPAGEPLRGDAGLDLAHRISPGT